jgi:hypothetical protein
MLRVRIGRTRRGIQEPGDIAVPSLCAASVSAFETDNVHAKTFCATQQVGVKRAP